MISKELAALQTYQKTCDLFIHWYIFDTFGVLLIPWITIGKSWIITLSLAPFTFHWEVLLQFHFLHA